MRFGFDLPTRQLTLHASAKREPEIATRENLTAIARRGEALGFDSIWAVDHVVIPLTSRGYPYSEDGTYPFDPKQNFFEPVTSLAYLAGCTTRIRLGTSVLVLPYRNPVLTAKMLATIDVLSSGRLIVGAGTGWWQEEFSALGLTSYHERGAHTDEHLRILKTLWTSEVSSFEGKYYRIRDVACYPKPVQQPHPPIWIGGQTTKALRRVVQFGDGWHPLALRKPVRLHPDELRAKIQELRRLAEVAGRDPARLDVCLRILLRITKQDDPDRPLTGTPGKVADDIRRYVAAGVTHFLLDLGMDSAQGMIETLDRFAADVRPECQ